jgi:hypothetical protein
MEENLFDYDNTHPFEAAELLKKQLVSEIDFIRDIMLVANMFLGEPLKLGTVLLQEIEGNINADSNE